MVAAGVEVVTIHDPVTVVVDPVAAVERLLAEAVVRLAVGVAAVRRAVAVVVEPVLAVLLAAEGEARAVRIRAVDQPVGVLISAAACASFVGTMQTA